MGAGLCKDAEAVSEPTTTVVEPQQRVQPRVQQQQQQQPQQQRQGQAAPEIAVAEPANNGDTVEAFSASTDGVGIEGPKKSALEELATEMLENERESGRSSNATGTPSVSNPPSISIQMKSKRVSDQAIKEQASLHKSIAEATLAGIDPTFRGDSAESSKSGKSNEHDSGQLSVCNIRWQKGELIGAGAFGRVYMGLNEDSGELIAVKQVAIASTANATKDRAEEHVAALEEEVAVLRNLQHPNIVRYLGTERDDEVLNIFLEYVPGGSIASLLQKFGPFTEKVIRMYARQLLQGLEFLHRHQIMHRDIKGANLLVDNNGIVKLADFGASKKLVDMCTIDSGYKSMKGTPYWMAPEVIKQTGHGRQADIWSVGCTIIEMATGKPPWSEFSSQVSALFHIASSQSSPPVPEFLSPEAHDFLRLCFFRNPKDRPNATRLLQHPFILNASTFEPTAGHRPPAVPVRQRVPPPISAVSEETNSQLTSKTVSLTAPSKESRPYMNGNGNVMRPAAGGDVLDGSASVKLAPNPRVDVHLTPPPTKGGPGLSIPGSPAEDVYAPESVVISVKQSENPVEEPSWNGQDNETVTEGVYMNEADQHHTPPPHHSSAAARSQPAQRPPQRPAGGAPQGAKPAPGPPEKKDSGSKKNLPPLETKQADEKEIMSYVRHKAADDRERLTTPFKYKDSGDRPPARATPAAASTSSTSPTARFSTRSISRANAPATISTLNTGNQSSASVLSPSKPTASRIERLAASSSAGSAGAGRVGAHGLSRGASDKGLERLARAAEAGDRPPGDKARLERSRTSAERLQAPTLSSQRRVSDRAASQSSTVYGTSSARPSISTRMSPTKSVRPGARDRSASSSTATTPTAGGGGLLRLSSGNPAATFGNGREEGSLPPDAVNTYTARQEAVLLRQTEAVIEKERLNKQAQWEAELQKELEHQRAEKRRQAQGAAPPRERATSHY